jgi:hypothetical protein
LLSPFIRSSLVHPSGPPDPELDEDDHDDEGSKDLDRGDEDEADCSESAKPIPK